MSGSSIVILTVWVLASAPWRAWAEVDAINRSLESDPLRLELAIEHPPDGGLAADLGCGTFVAGHALMQGAPKKFDIAIVLDTSGSTAEPSGTDINGNGEVGRAFRSPRGMRSSDPGDSVLAAEIAAARELLRRLDPRTTRVALITFSGGFDQRVSRLRNLGRRTKRNLQPAYTRSPLTHDFERVEATLQFIANAGSDGGTNMAAGVRLGFIELSGLSGSRSEARDDAAKLMFFFTDGVPTAPFPPDQESRNISAVFDEAKRARILGVVVHSFAVGPTAIEKPIAVVDLSQITGGSFTPVRDPGVLSSIVQAVDFANLQEVAVRSVTHGSYADPLWVGADGSWGGLLKLAPGLNQLEVVARTRDGSRVLEQTSAFAQAGVVDGELPELPPALAARRHRLLQECLQMVRRERIAAEREAKHKIRRTLVLEIERERAAARRRAGEQRKTLTLEVGDEDKPPEVP